MLLSFCLIFCQFHPGVAYKSVVYIKSVYFIENDLITQSQSGFKPGDSCINHLISITHEIYQSFDDGHKVRGAFLMV